MKRVVIALLFVVALAVSAGAQPGRSVVVVAPSVSTRMQAREVRAQLQWTETTNWKMAQGVLVVVRSMLFNPLDRSYESTRDSIEDAESQLNISGSNFHIYVYSLHDDLTLTQESHRSYTAKD